jgi:peptide chain release factor 2
MSLDRLNNLKKKIEETATLLRLDELKIKMKQLSDEMNAPDFWSNQENAQAVSADYEDLRKETAKWDEIKKSVDDLIELSAVSDEGMSADIEARTGALEKQFADYEFFLLLNGPYDANNAVVAIHAGSGGTEAQDWAEMLLRMVTRFAEQMHWRVKIIDESRGAEAGYKSIMFEVKGRHAYGYLKSEHGVHRLVRISPFDAEKMRHTSFALIEVLPELDEKINIEIKPEDLRIDTFMSGGHGGQSVNTTYSAVRIVHTPTGISVSCQNERSQQQNKETALKVLKAKLFRLEQEKMAKEKQELRGEYKSAEWGSQIRSYVLHPYHLVKDHRTEYESADPEGVLEGNLLPLSEAYLKWIKT